MAALTFKLLIAVLSAALGALALRLKSLVSLSDRRFVVLALSVQLVPALALFFALYVVGHQQVTSDVPTYYIPAGHAVLSGQVPFRDFISSYAPLFPYVSAGLLRLWDSGKIFALLAIALDAATLLLWHEVALATLGRPTARQATVLFAASGQVLVQALLGTNQCWIAAAIGGSALLLVRAQSSLSGALQGVAICCVKILAVLFWPVFWVLTPRRLSWLAGALLPSALVYGSFAMLGADLAQPLTREGELISSGNLPYLLEPLLAGSAQFVNRLFDGLALLALAATAAWLYFKTRRLPDTARARLLMPALALVALVFMICSKKSFPGYILFCMYPLMLVLVLCIPGYVRRVALFALLNALLATESSLWFHLGGNNMTLSEWLHTGKSAHIALLLAVDAALIACYLYLAWLAAGWLRGTTRDVMSCAEAGR